MIRANEVRPMFRRLADVAERTGCAVILIGHDEKALQHQLKQLTRKERTHRLCTRGGMLESFLQEPERLTDDDVMLLLKLIFHRQDTQELLKKLLEREKP